MPRLTELNDVLFPVEEWPVFVIAGSGAGLRSLPVPDKKAIVGRDDERVLGFVSRDYRLVTNQEAFELARECCRTVFPETKPGEWEVRTVDAPASARHCFIDLAHNSAMLDFSVVPASQRPDAFGPFIRVTNSYNAVRALAFDIGFYRKVCRNGLILPESIIRFKFTHLHRDIGKAITFDIAHDRLVKMKASFAGYIGVLRDCHVGRSAFEPLFFAVLMVRKPRNARPGSPEERDWASLQKHVRGLCDRYAGDLGENAYAVLNAVTEFASHPPENRCVRRERHSFERLAGSWVNDFSREAAKPGFDLGRYIDKLGKDSSKSEQADAVTVNPRRPLQIFS